jgi:ribonuclease-3
MKRKRGIYKRELDTAIDEFVARLPLQPAKPELFRIAFTHSSYGNEHNLPHNERLEFLGDSVIAVIVCSFLYHLYPNYTDGQLAKLKSTIVSTEVFVSFAQQLELNRFFRLGHGELRSDGLNKRNLLEDLFEAFIGAYYLNFGLEATTEFIVPLIKERLPELIRQTKELNAKTDLQEWAQLRGKWMPEYRLLKDEGPPHNRTFTVEVLYKKQVLGCGTAKTLKEAQCKAAVIALEKVRKPGAKF